jgi:hypothetical protein
MSTEDKMTIDERWKCLRQVQSHYAKADREEKSRILTNMELVTGMHRKSLIRRLNGSLERRCRSREREETYRPDVDDALRVIDESWGQICADLCWPESPSALALCPIAPFHTPKNPKPSVTPCLPTVNGAFARRPPHPFHLACVERTFRGPAACPTCRCGLGVP